MRKLLAVLLLSAAAYGTTTVTGTISTLGTGTIGQGAFVRFWLRGCGGNQPRVGGVGVIGPTQGGVFYFDFAANGSGAISGTLYSTRDNAGTGNGDIECGGSKTAVWYGMQIFVAGKGGPEVAVHAKSGSTLDISNVSAITTNPVVTAPTGDNTYLRLDAGNSPITGPIVFGSTISATSGGTLGGTFGGSPTLSGNLTFSGNVSFTGTKTLTNAGVFTNTQMNEYTQSLINNCSPQTEFQSVQGGSNFATEGLVGCINFPANGTVYQGNAVAGYANTAGSQSGTTQNVVAGYFSCRVTGTAGHCWGIDPVLFDVHNVAFTGLKLLNEFDVQPQNAPSQYSTVNGLLMNFFAPTANTGLADGATFTNAFAFFCSKGQAGGIWQACYNTSDGSAAVYAVVGSIGLTANSNSQPINFNYRDGTNTVRVQSIFADNSGTFTINPFNGKLVIDAAGAQKLLLDPSNNTAVRTVTTPDASGVLGVSLNSGSSLYQSKRAVTGCTTGAAAGNNCGTDITVTWGTAFADANYSVTCTGNAPTNAPSGPYVVSGTKLAATVHINYFAITAAAASYSTIDCIAVHD